MPVQPASHLTKLRIILITLALFVFVACTPAPTDTADNLIVDRWRLPAPPTLTPDQISLPTVWLGSDGSEAVLGTMSAFSYQDKSSGLNVHGDPAIPSASNVANTNLAPDRSGVIIIAAEYGTIQSIEVWIRPWKEAVENFALFEGERIQGESSQAGDIFTHTLTPLGTTEDSLLVVHIQFDNPRENGDALYIWRLNASLP